MSVMVNCAYLDQKFPRLVTTAHMRDLHRHKKNRLIGIADISCDINGGTTRIRTHTHTVSTNQPPVHFHAHAVPL